MRRHVSAVVLARYQAADLGSWRSARVAAHLSGCERCAGTVSELTAVTAVLASIDRPAMPSSVVERLQIVIATESGSRAAVAPAAEDLTSAGLTGLAADAADTADGPEAGRPGVVGEDAAPAHIPGRPGLPERGSGRRSARPRPHRPGLSSPLLLRGAAAAAAVALLAGGGFLLARSTTGPEAGSTAGSPTGPEHRSANSPASLNGGTRLQYRSRGKVISALAVASHKNFTRTGLAGQVRREVASHPAFGLTTPAYGKVNPSPGANGSQQPVAVGGISVGRLDGCLTLVAGGRQVVLTEVARYIGKPATIIVLKSQTANMLDVAIVGVACSARAADYIVRTMIPAG